MPVKRPFLIYSDYGDGLFFALRLVKEQARVQFYIDQKYPDAQRVGSGLVPRPSRLVAQKGTIVIFDASGHVPVAHKLRVLGCHVVNGSRLEELEIDRFLGAKIAAEHGIAVPETHPFTSVKDATRFLEGQKEDSKFYMKISGHETDTMETYNARTTAMMIRYLLWWESCNESAVPFALQRRVPGTEVSCEGWWDGKRFVPPFNATIEEKKFMAGNTGERTGCESDLVWLLEGEAPKLAQLTIMKLEPVLRKYKEPTQFDINSIIGEDGLPYWLEATVRPGYDATPALFHLVKGSAAEQLEAFALGALKEWDFKPEAAMTIRITVPPYPVPDSDLAARYDGLPLDKTLLHDNRITLTDVRLDEDGLPVLAGRDGHVGTVGAVGTDLRRMREEMLTLAHGLEIPNLRWRPDPVTRAEADLRALQGHNFLSHKGLSVYLQESMDPQPAAPESEK